MGIKAKMLNATLSIGEMRALQRKVRCIMMIEINSIVVGQVCRTGLQCQTSQNLYRPTGPWYKQG